MDICAYCNSILVGWMLAIWTFLQHKAFPCLNTSKTRWIHQPDFNQPCQKASVWCLAVHILTIFLLDDIYSHWNILIAQTCPLFNSKTPFCFFTKLCIYNILTSTQSCVSHLYEEICYLYLQKSCVSNYSISIYVKFVILMCPPSYSLLCQSLHIANMAWMEYFTMI